MAPNTNVEIGTREYLAWAETEQRIADKSYRKAVEQFRATKLDGDMAEYARKVIDAWKADAKELVVENAPAAVTFSYGRVLPVHSIMNLAGALAAGFHANETEEVEAVAEYFERCRRTVCEKLLGDIAAAHAVLIEAREEVGRANNAIIMRPH